MAYDDRPLWEQDKSYRMDETMNVKVTVTPPKLKLMEGYRGIANAIYPSQLYCWWETERNKMKAGLENEIDQNEIRAALLGVLNKWSKVVNTDKPLFEKYIHTKKVSWSELPKFF